MQDSTLIQIIIMMGGTFTGIFAIFKYFLNHLQQKNGHMERMAADFSKALKDTIDPLTRQMIRQQATDEKLAESINDLLTVTKK